MRNDYNYYWDYVRELITAVYNNTMFFYYFT